MEKKISIFIIVIIITILIIISISAKKTLNLNKLNNVYKDIETLEDKIAIYYLDYGTIPVKDKKIEFSENSINPNDSEIYYEIDLDKIENLKIFYGKKVENENDVYIINEQSHTLWKSRISKLSIKILKKNSAKGYLKVIFKLH